MITVAWSQTGKKRGLLMGKVLEDCGNHYRVLVTSWDIRSLAKYEGKEMMVSKSNAQITK